MEGYHRDIEHAIEYWIQVLNDFGVTYAYAKGSAVKRWDSKIDYVPIISDLDIHYRLESDPEFDLQQSIAIMIEYENYMNEFQCQHIPRMQLMALQNFQESFVPPLPEQIQPIIGRPSLAQIPKKADFRDIDRSRLFEEREYLERMAERAFECTGIEVWRRVREVTWRVSPAPVRLLSQIEEPSETWTWNRTTISDKLEQHGFDDLAEDYREFYILGWDYFEAGLINTKIGLEMYRTAFDVIKSSIEEIRQLN
jgi:hypothetical protein